VVALSISLSISMNSIPLLDVRAHE
jgi:hypothetical protein